MVGDQEVKNQIANGTRDFRVYWESIYPGGSRFAYPAQEPLLTYAEATAKAKDEQQKWYVRAWVIDRRGLQA